MQRIFLALPSYDGWRCDGNAEAAHKTATRKHQVFPVPKGGSLITGSCNYLLATALNAREQYGFTWFAMLHADIAPEPFFIDKMIDEAEAHGADLLSVVIPLKSTDCLTSTNIGSGRRFMQFGRLTMRQVHYHSFPRTFDIHMAADALESLPPPLGVANVPRVALLANTGCMIVRLDQPWSDRLLFRQLDAMFQLDDGTYQARDLSEDFYFSWRAARLGARVMCTTTVQATHLGQYQFPNDQFGPLAIANDCVEREIATEIKTYYHTPVTA